jgi:serine/threonine protein kinase/tetratricopeptide (TPR) repeat protein
MSDPCAPSDGQASQFDPVADLVARVILALECDGQQAVDDLLAAEPAHGAAARERIQALRDAGMLREQGDALPERIGPFRILERLGRGGMGEVYLAEQRVPVARRVALKLIRRGMDTREVLARFALERQALALLDHPNIAKIHDAGETVDGRPYLVMEYVSGAPITAYCDERGLDTEARLRLFVEVCETVQHAHERGILHRDIKPSNVLVTDRDGRPWPKLIDLGVAKSMQHRLQAATLHTELGRVLGTPGYMSPEQAANRIDLDTRTDVYSLGVLLYELLTGQLPIAGARLQRIGPSELERILRDEDPPTPSTRIGTLGAASTEIAARRGTAPAALRRQLRGDLDWVTMKALERDRNRRYPMAAALAQDVRRHLAFEPVTAGPPGAWYQLSRLVRRHRAASAATLAVLVSLIAGLVVSVTFYREARAAQGREAAARADVEQALDVALHAADELLVQVGGDRLRRFPGLASERQHLLESGLQFCRSVMERAPPRSRNAAHVALVQLRIAWFLFELDLVDEAERALDEVSLPPSDDPEAPEVQLAHAHVVASIAMSRSRPELALEARQRATAAASALLARAPDDPRLQDQEGVCLGRLAAAWIALDPSAAATEQAVQAAHAATQRAVARDAPPTPHLSQLLRSWAEEASWRIERSQPQEAGPVLIRLEARIRQMLDAAPEDLALLEDLAPALEMRARTLLLAGEAAESERASREAIAIRERLQREFPGDPTIGARLADAQLVLVDNLIARFRFQDALDLAASSIALREALLARDPASPKARAGLAFALGKQAMAWSDWHRLKPDLDLGAARAASARAVELVTGLVDDPRREPDLAFRISHAWFVRGQLAEAMSDLTTARNAFLEALPRAERLVATLRRNASMVITLEGVLRGLGRVQLGLGENAAARASLARAVDLEEDLRSDGALYMDSRLRLRETLNLLARAELAGGDPEAAVATAERAIACAPEYQVTHREAVSLFLAIASAVTPEARPRLLARALQASDLARETLRQQNGSGPEGTAGLMYRLTEHGLLRQRITILEGLPAGPELEATWREILGLAQAIRTARDDDRARGHLRAAYEALIAAAEARGDDAAAGVLRRELESAGLK